MPIIFASSFMIFPPLIIGQLSRIPALDESAILQNIYDALSYRAYTYNVLYMLLIFLFAYFWVTVQFQPKEMAKNLRDSGSFIPGLRPGRRTADYLETVGDYPVLARVDRIGEETDTTILFVTHHREELPDCIRQVLKMENTRRGGTSAERTVSCLAAGGS